jgi:hypothetical protein
MAQDEVATTDSAHRAREMGILGGTVGWGGVPMQAETTKHSYEEAENGMRRVHGSCGAWISSRTVVPTLG